MAFLRSSDYFARKINNIKEAIQGTEQSLKGLSENRQIEAHESQIASYKKDLVKTEIEHRNWRNKQQNIENGTMYRGY